MCLLSSQKALQQAVGSGLAGELKDPASEKGTRNQKGRVISASELSTYIIRLSIESHKVRAVSAINCQPLERSAYLLGNPHFCEMSNYVNWFNNSIFKIRTFSQLPYYPRY